MQSRRLFLAGSAAALSASAASRLRGASERVQVGVIGCGVRGGHLVAAFQAQPDCDVVAVCDVFRPNLEKVRPSAAPGAEAYKDYRQVIARKDIDAIVIATPDHWHAPILIAACEAGKDVYVEKPLSNAIDLAQAMVAAVREHKRVVQVGLQQRSWDHFKDAYELFQKGQLGKINHVGLVRRPSRARPNQPPQEPPPDLDWEMFQGPAERTPYSTTKQRDWRRFPQFGGGVLTDWCIHLLDVALWYLRADTKTPQKISAAAGTFWRPPDDRLPDTVSVNWRYEDFVVTFTNWGQPYGTYFFGEHGSLHVDREGYTLEPYVEGPQPRARFDRFDREVVEDYPSINTSLGSHVRNFLDCMKSREKPLTNIDIGFNSTLPTLLALLSVKTGKTYTWDGKTAQVVS
jgi:predicted dehydrogenase